MSHEASRAVSVDPGPVPTTPAPAKTARLQATLAPAAKLFREYFTPLSAASLLGVIAIMLACVALWDVDWLRPYLVAGGAGLAAFLGPIPGIISAEARNKWLASVVVAALITIGTWIAARDLDERLDQAAAHEKFVLAALRDLPPQGRSSLFLVTPRK